MKAAILYKANTPLEVVDVQQQGPQGGEARVRVKAPTWTRSTRSSNRAAPGR